jgi:hypothetical protein
MKKLLLPAAILLLSVAAAAQTCTVTGTSPYNWPMSAASVSCAEGGNAAASSILVIPAGMTVVFDSNTDTWSGTRIDVYGTLRVTANPVINASVTVKSGGLVDLQGKLALGSTAGCNYKVIVDAGATVTLGVNAAERLTICDDVILRGGGLGTCNSCGGTNSGRCAYDGTPYCQPVGGFTGPAAWGEEGFNSSLPVKLLYFNAESRNEMVVCKWATIVEENFHKFFIQRSIDGVTFEDIGEVEGQGFNIQNIESKYSFVDEAPMLGTNYYRLKAVDLDNEYEYFDVRAVRMNGSKKLAVYPNPSNGEHISFRANFNYRESDRIVLTDQLGVEVFSTLASAIENNIVFPGPLQPGVYMLRYVSKDFEQVHRVVVRH